MEINWFIRIKNLYDSGCYKPEALDTFVQAKFITEEEKILLLTKQSRH
ncbi:XkdX family protein [Gottschalkia acidurici]|nr:XkdX family protein [Gottschalkia acidurici]